MDKYIQRQGRHAIVQLHLCIPAKGNRNGTWNRPTSVSKGAPSSKKPAKLEKHSERSKYAAPFVCAPCGWGTFTKICVPVKLTDRICLTEPMG